MNQADLFSVPHIQSGSSIIARRPDGYALRDHGMELATLNERAAWLAAYEAFVLSWLHSRAVPFLAEEVRTAWTESGRPSPHAHNVWGAAFNRMVRKGFVRKTGKYRNAQSPATHAHAVAEWAKADPALSRALAKG
jgi:hypothetical protein